MDEIRGMRWRLARIFVLLAGLLLVGTSGYHVLAGWSFLDSLYMTVITLTTVGYGETHPLGPGGRWFTIFFLLGGIGTMTYVFSAVTSMIVEGDLSAAIRRKRMEKEIAKLSGHYVVCGAGRSGGVIAAELHRTQRSFVLVDRQPEAIQKLRDRLGDGGFPGVIGDATDDEVLRAAGADRAVGVFAVLATDQDNAFVALSAKGLNPGVRIVCSQKEPGVREKLFRSGADHVVDSEHIGGLRMASEMIRPATVGFLDAMMREGGSVVRFEEILVPATSPFVGLSVGEVVGAPGRGPLLVAVLDARTGKYDINPDSGRKIEAGDRLVMVGEIGRLAELQERISSRR